MKDVKDILDEAQEKMDMAVMYLEESLAHIRAGKADVRLLDGIRVDSYGSMVPINNVAAVTTPDARSIAIKPWDKSMFRIIEKAIIDSDLGIMPENNGEIIRIGIPPLTDSKFFKKLEQPTHSALHSPQKDIQVKAHDALHLAQLHALALGQAGQRTAVEAAQLGQLGVIAGVHEGAGLWQLQRTALLEHLTDELGAEIMPTALPADMHPAEQQTQRIEAVELPVVHHVLGAALGAGVGLVRHFQRVEGTGDVLPHEEHAPVQVFPAGTCGEHGVKVVAPELAVKLSEAFT